MYRIGELCKLTKVPLCSMVACSSAFGYLLREKTLNCNFFLATCGVFFLACGGAALNSLQERNEDAHMQRTKKRPLVTGTVAIHTAYGLALACILLGSALLLYSHTETMPFFLGLAGLILYNGIYTPLKKRSSFALLPGAISGALPPAIGWIAAGGSLHHPLIWCVMILFFLWQPPHSCLVMLRYEQVEEQDNLPIHLTTLFPKQRSKQIISIWLFSFITMVLFLATLPDFLHFPARAILALIAPLFLVLFLSHLLMSPSPQYKLLFVSLNSFLLSLMLLLSLSNTTAAYSSINSISIQGDPYAETRSSLARAYTVPGFRHDSAYPRCLRQPDR